MPTDTDKKLNGTPEPFRRPVVWGRPPATVFRAGPLPKGGGLPPLPEAPRMRPAPGILTGSMIPRAAPTRSQTGTQAPAAVPPVARAPESREDAAVPRPAMAAADGPDLTVRPLPAVEPEPARLPEAAHAPAPAQPVVFAAEADAAPGAAAVAARKPASRVPLYAGVALAAVTVLALGAWIWTRPPAEAPVPGVATAPAPAVPAPETLAPEIVVPESAPTEDSVTEAVVDAPVPVPAPPADRAPATAAAPARTPAAPATIQPAPPAPEVVAPPPTVSPPPLIVIAPAPTAAERPSTNPDEPIATRPQPIG